MWGACLGDEAASPDSWKVDYLSKTHPVALYLSLKKRHWTVVLSILGILLLQLTAVFSTSLLERETRAVSYRVHDLRTSKTFMTPETFLQYGIRSHNEMYFINIP
ncbi:hypothetical protein B0H63DRAFT_468257 [Podospora didyma]|uniref:Uncharacterized protein n=1 Tax=Podospora didyma TaxID=330526 RepID=A0AAE0NS76_9PEZI|nr:hypothetical protein B0H63DRAFT_468257 [Podospora didyma]